MHVGFYVESKALAWPNYQNFGAYEQPPKTIKVNIGCSTSLDQKQIYLNRHLKKN